MGLHSQLDEIIEGFLPVVQSFHSQGMLAPHAVSIDHVGALTGQALTMDGTAQVSVLEAIAHFEHAFTARAKSADIQACGIFYHSPGIDFSASSLSLPPAETSDECRTIVALLEHASGDSVYLMVPYSGEGDQIEYGIGKLISKPAKIFAAQRE